MRKAFLLAVFCTCTSVVASAQVAEFSVSGGVSRIGGNPLLDLGGGNTIDLNNGARIALRMTLNTYRFFGHEFGYGYSHTSIPGAVFGVSGNVGISVHSGFYDFLVYATPEGSRIRPFVTGGVQFNSFVPPGGSSYYSVTKFGVNYGGGLKFNVSGPFGARIDFRQYNMGKPDVLQYQGFPAPSGRMNITEITAGFSFSL